MDLYACSIKYQKLAFNNIIFTTDAKCELLICNLLKQDRYTQAHKDNLLMRIQFTQVY